MGLFGNLLNTITSPFGFKLESGGPYPDAGMGDKALANAGQVAGYGQQLLTPDLMARLTNSMGTNQNALAGYSSYLPSMVSGYANTMGIQDPFSASQRARDAQTAGGGYGQDYLGAFNETYQPAQSTDPYSLDPNQRQQLSMQTDQYAIQRKAALDNLRAGFVQRGITNPQATAAAEQAINEHFDTLAAQAPVQAGQTARGLKETGYTNLQNMIGNIYNTQTGARQQDMNQLLTGTGLMSGLTSQYNQAGQAATAKTDMSNQALMSGLAMLLGGVPGTNFGGVLGGSSAAGTGGSAGTNDWASQAWKYQAGLPQ